MNLFVHDWRVRWGRALSAAARRRRWRVKNVNRADEIDRDGFGFCRVSASPRLIADDKALGFAMCDRLTVITDRTQIAVYDDKRAQTRLWSDWMPETWIFEDAEEALRFAESADYPLVAKADVGASSANILLLGNRYDALEHLREVFGPGRLVHNCSGDGAKSLQRGYAILQRFVPHEITYRVNAVGTQRAVFFRKCYPDRPMAQTGNVEPAYAMSPELESLFDYANRFFRHAETQWCALDILKDGDEWKLLETSLAWPHPSPGDCNNATFFPSGAKWIDMWDVLLNEAETGVFSASGSH